MIEVLEGVNIKDMTEKIKVKLNRIYTERANMLIQQRSCIERYNLQWNSEKACYEFPFSSIEDDYIFVDSVYLGKRKECFIKATNEPVAADKAEVILNNISVKEEYKQSMSNDIMNLFKKFLNVGKKVSYNKIDRKYVNE